MKFLELAKTVLQEVQKPMSGSEIWQVAKEKGYVDKLETAFPRSVAQRAGSKTNKLTIVAGEKGLCLCV
ncbi:MAG: HTH domain-containing protein [Bacteroidota bacterium]